MCQFLETIQLLDGEFKRLPLHQKRMELAVKSRYGNENVILNLRERLNNIDFPKTGLYKCRVIYSTLIEKIEFQTYNTPAINSLKIIHVTIPSLPYKLFDRTDYQNAFNQKGNHDDVLLIKDGLLTDTSYCNVALFDGKEWFTPTTPLIYGINRSELLSSKKILTKDIHISELNQYTHISLFNAMNAHLSIILPISNVSI